MRLFTSLAAILISVTSLSAGVVNFSPLSQDGTDFAFVNGGGSYSQGGLTFSDVSGPALSTWQRSSLNHASGGDAATGLTVHIADHVLQITATNGSPFSISSIDLAQWGYGQGTPETTFEMTFFGNEHGGGIVGQVFEVPLSLTPAFQTYTFSNSFTNLDSVYFIQGTYHLGTGIQINNVVTDVEGVPEPGTLALVLGGAALLLPRIRRRT